MTTFADRHIGTDAAAQEIMLQAVGYSSVDDLMDAAVPTGIRAAAAISLPEARSEREALAELRVLAGRNRVRQSMIGLGYHGTITPSVIRRNVLESPAWYTAYTPYQPEISQGRLEALLNFQTVIADLGSVPYPDFNYINWSQTTSALTVAVDKAYSGELTAAEAIRAALEELGGL